MPNIGQVLKEEISRISRREIRRQTGVVRRASAQYRRDIANLKRQVAELQAKTALQERQLAKIGTPSVKKEQVERARFSAKGLRSLRRRLGLSAEQLAVLIGVSGQTVYNWEREISRPRKKQFAALLPLRNMGKKEALARVEQLQKVRKSA